MKRLIFLLCLVSLVLVAFSIRQPEDPQAVFTQTIKSVSTGTLPELTLRMAESFLDVPYVAHTLEANETEQLVCRFDALDCTTLVDVSVALALAKKKNLDYPQFLDQMTRLRYQDGRIDGYPSRLHYFLSWRNQGISNGLLTDVTEQLGGIPYDKSIDFMSAHADLYKGISSETALNSIKTNEKRLNNAKYDFIPKAQVKKIEAKLQDGDIIGITSTIPGLDCNHQGVVKKKGDRAYLVHASTTAHRVIVSPTPLSDYLNSIKRHSGIIVLRLK